MLKNCGQVKAFKRSLWNFWFHICEIFNIKWYFHKSNIFHISQKSDLLKKFRKVQHFDFFLFWGALFEIFKEENCWVYVVWKMYSHLVSAYWRRQFMSKVLAPLLSFVGIISGFWTLLDHHSRCTERSFFILFEGAIMAKANELEN